MKGLTNIPFARQAAERIQSPEQYTPDYTIKEMSFWARVVHFESRYWSIDQLLKELPIKNILELSSGFSFRGLEMVKQEGVHYIDTDLPEVIATKKELIASLQGDNPNGKSKLEILPLNALDENQFTEIINHFPPGEIVIVNERLLMYLNTEEKEKLCSIIYKILKTRGGYWITADIYIKNKVKKLSLKWDEQMKEFFERHNIEENKFESFESAEVFFKQAGFVIDKKAKPDHSNLSSLKYLLRSANLWQLIKMKRGSRIQETWRLKVK